MLESRSRRKSFPTVVASAQSLSLLHTVSALKGATLIVAAMLSGNVQILLQHKITTFFVPASQRRLAEMVRRCFKHRRTCITRLSLAILPTLDSCYEVDSACLNLLRRRRPALRQRRLLARVVHLLRQVGRDKRRRVLAQQLSQMQRLELEGYLLRRKPAVWSHHEMCGTKDNAGSSRALPRFGSGKIVCAFEARQKLLTLSAVGMKSCVLSVSVWLFLPDKS